MSLCVNKVYGVDLGGFAKARSGVLSLRYQLLKASEILTVRSNYKSYNLEPISKYISFDQDGCRDLS
jgi:hypothetical protein